GAYVAADNGEPANSYDTNWTDNKPTESYENETLGLSEQAHPIDGQPESESSNTTGTAPQNSSDWYSDAFGANQGGTSTREASARAAEEEQLRQVMLETIVVDESDTGNAGGTFGQDMGRS
ncbi:hypothetical protein T35B1_11817, partial [Salinisphaera shabanensis T35B1]